MKALALFAALQATFADIHPVCDQWLQTSRQALGKGEPGWAGRVCCTQHVATYTTVQAVAAITVTRVLGYRIPASAFAAGMAITAVTHYAIDRRRGFIRLIRAVGKGDYLDRCTVQRCDGTVHNGGPGTALMELDQAAHRVIGVATSLLVAVLAVRAEAAR